MRYLSLRVFEYDAIEFTTVTAFTSTSEVGGLYLYLTAELQSELSEAQGALLVMLRTHGEAASGSAAVCANEV